jgi:hypothetical protein
LRILPRRLLTHIFLAIALVTTGNGGKSSTGNATGGPGGIGGGNGGDAYSYVRFTFYRFQKRYTNAWLITLFLVRPSS